MQSVTTVGEQPTGDILKNSFPHLFGYIVDIDALVLK
jgi:hypothetical protein